MPSPPDQGSASIRSKRTLGLYRPLHISTDPVGLNAGVNLYRYVRRNPIRFNDPSGTQDEESSRSIGYDNGTLSIGYRSGEFSFSLSINLFSGDYSGSISAEVGPVTIESPIEPDQPLCTLDLSRANYDYSSNPYKPPVIRPLRNQVLAEAQDQNNSLLTRGMAFTLATLSTPAWIFDELVAHPAKNIPYYADLAGQNLALATQAQTPGDQLIYGTMSVRDFAGAFSAAAPFVAPVSRPPLPSIYRPGTGTTNRGLAYRALDATDVERIEAGKGLAGKNPQGGWTAAEHVANQPITSALEGSAATQSPWISTTRSFGAARNFESGRGIAIIDLGKVRTPAVEVWRDVPRTSFLNEMAYQRSLWHQEVTVLREIPPEAIIRVTGGW